MRRPAYLTSSTTHETGQTTQVTENYRIKQISPTARLANVQLQHMEKWSETHDFVRSHREEVCQEGWESGRKAALRYETKLQLGQADGVVSSLPIPARNVQQIRLKRNEYVQLNGRRPKLKEMSATRAEFIERQLDQMELSDWLSSSLYIAIITTFIERQWPTTTSNGDFLYFRLIYNLTYRRMVTSRVWTDERQAIAGVEFSRKAATHVVSHPRLNKLWSRNSDINKLSDVENKLPFLQSMRLCGM